MSASRKTKIVATIGPATESEAELAGLIRAGMNVARFNTKHNEPSWHLGVLRRLRKVAGELQTPIGALVDLQGPEIRISLNIPSFHSPKGTQLRFTSEEFLKNERDIIIPLNVVQSLNVGNHVVLDDGACHFVVSAKTDQDLMVECLDDCIIKTRKTLNTPNVVIDMPALTESDLTYLDELSAEEIDYVALSFVSGAEDLHNLRKVLHEKNIHAQVVAKIENRKALENLEEIVRASDCVMIGRGDLAVEVNYEEMVYWQKKVIVLCRWYNKPVITATQMLASMVEKPMPSRAEISDVGHAVYDGTDAVMLSEETTIGKFPLRVVNVQSTICQFCEAHPAIWESPREQSQTAFQKSVLEKIAQQSDHATKIFLIGDNVEKVHQVASMHLSLPVSAITTDLSIAQKITLAYGIEALVQENPNFSLGEKAIIIYTSTDNVL